MSGSGDVVIEMMVWGGGSGGSDGVSAGLSRLVCCAGGRWHGGTTLGLQAR